MFTISDYVTTTYDGWYKQYHVPASDLTAKLDTVISLLQQLVDRKLPRLSDGPSVDPIVVSYPTVGTEPPYQVGTVPVSVAEPLAVTTTFEDADLRLAVTNAKDESGPTPLLIKTNECLEVTSCPSKPFEIAQPVDVAVVNRPTVDVGNHISATVDGAVTVSGAVEVSGFVGVTGVVEVVNTSVLGIPVPLAIAGVTTGPPIHVTIDGDVSLHEPVSVVADSPLPVTVENEITISNTTPLPVEIESAPTLQVEVMNQTLVTSPLISAPIPIEAASPLPTIVTNTPPVS